MKPSRELRLHVGILALVAVACVLVYARVTGAFFCSYDDFYELHRAKFEDAGDPARIFTTAHFGSQRYRPLNRAANFVTYKLGGVRAFPFRARNLAFHVLNVVLLYTLGLKLFSSVKVGALGALLFAIHPLANQSLVGAVVTNSLAYSFVLSACIASVVAADSRRRSSEWLGVGLILGWLGLLTYDPAVAVYLLIGLFLFLRFVLSPTGADRRRIIIWVVGTVVCLAAYLAMRLLLVPSGFGKAASSFPSLGRLSKDLALYAVALMSPVDPVLANATLGVPFPSEVNLEGAVPRLIAVVLVFLALVIVAGAVRWLARKGYRLRGANLVGALFLSVGILVQLAPVLIFGKRPSETYLYLPAAFASLLFAFLIVESYSVARGPLRYAFVVIGISAIGLSGAATYVRNSRVRSCGVSAARVLAGIPCPEPNDKGVTIRVSSLSDAQRSRRYGFYGFSGTDTIGDGVHASPALTAALQLFCGDLGIRGEVVTPDDLRDRCRTEAKNSASKSFWVDSDGRTSACEAFNR